MCRKEGMQEQVGFAHVTVMFQETTGCQYNNGVKKSKKKIKKHRSAPKCSSTVRVLCVYCILPVPSRYLAIREISAVPLVMDKFSIAGMKLSAAPTLSSRLEQVCLHPFPRRQVDR